MILADRRNALVTAHIAKDEEAMRSLLVDMPRDELAPMCGALVAYVGNMVGLVAAGWGCSDEEAWETILGLAARGGSAVKVRQHNSTLSADTDKPLKRKAELRRTEGPKSKGRRKPNRPISEASPEQRAKVRRMGFCIACGKSLSVYRAIDPAHVIDRSLGGCDHEDCVVPLCRTFDGGCHREYDEHRLELLPILERDGAFRREQAHAVLHLGIAGAFERTTGFRWRAPGGRPVREAG